MFTKKLIGYPLTFDFLGLISNPPADGMGCCEVRGSETSSSCPLACLIVLLMLAT